MPIKFQCGHCGASIKAPDTHAGQTLPCPKCGQPVVVMADVAAPPLPSVQPVVPPVASAPPSVPPVTSAPPAAVPPSVAPPSGAVPPPAQVFPAVEEEGDAVIPEIVPRGATPSVTPELDFVGAAPKTAEPIASPRAPRAARARRARVADVELQNVRVVDVRMSWGSMFWLVFQFYVCVLALSIVVGLGFMALSALFAA